MVRKGGEKGAVTKRLYGGLQALLFVILSLGCESNKVGTTIMKSPPSIG